jgi:hypothetical protein
MKSFHWGMALAITFSLAAWAQDATAPSPGNAPGGQQGNTDQTAKPTEPRGHTTIIGCLSGPDASGKFTLRSMEHRTGVEVLGSDDVENASGEKVKLTGLWKPGDQPARKGKESRKFQASEVEVMSEKCQAPSEKTPVSKQKQAQQQEKQQRSAPVSGDTTAPK